MSVNIIGADGKVDVIATLRAAHDEAHAVTLQQQKLGAQADAIDTTSLRAIFQRDLDTFRKALDDVNASAAKLAPYVGAVPVAGPFLVLAAQGISIATTAVDAIDDALEPVGL